MKTTCPSCNTTQFAVAFNMTDKEIINLRKIGLSEHLCKVCYNKELSALLTITKSELIPLNEQLQSTQLAYYKAHEDWKIKADLFKAIDYNIALIKHEDQKKEKIASKQPRQSSKPINIETLAKQIMANLNQEQQEAIIRSFQTNKTSEAI